MEQNDSWETDSRSSGLKAQNELLCLQQPTEVLQGDCSSYNHKLFYISLKGIHHHITYISIVYIYIWGTR
jgi:hypothetical protein